MSNWRCEESVRLYFACYVYVCAYGVEIMAWVSTMPEVLLN